MKFLVLLLLLSSSSFASYLDESFQKAADRANVPVALLRAVCFAESKHKFYAYNYADAGGENHAFGLCQLLRTTAFMYVTPDERCKRDFRKDPETKKYKIPRTYSECKLFGMYTNAYAAARFLRDLLNRYDNSWTHAIAAYNAGSIKLCPKRGYLRLTLWNPYKHEWQKREIKCTPGGFLNVYYIDRVLKALERGR